MALSPEPTILCFCVLSLMLICSTTAQSQRNVSLGSLLIAQNNSLSWESSSGEFAFGFQRVGKEGFLLSIWFNKIPQRTIVWSANRNSLVQEGSKVELTQFGFFLKDQKGNQIWNADTGVAYAAMLDTGNFVLANEGSVYLWESFNEPTDTLLPAQSFPQGRLLVARYSETNYSSGKFQLILQMNGVLALYTRKLPLETRNYVYWKSNNRTVDRLIFNQSGFVYLESKNGTFLDAVLLRSNDSSAQEILYQRVVFEQDGVFRHYVYLKKDNNQGSWEWNTVKFTPSNICTSILEQDGPGACGFNSYCSLGNDPRPKCHCPNGYTFINPNDEKKGCNRIFDSQTCNKNHSRDVDDLFYFYSMENTDWPQSEYDYFQLTTEDWCRLACLSDCFCAVAVFRNGECWKRKVPLKWKDGPQRWRESYDQNRKI